MALPSITTNPLGFAKVRWTGLASTLDTADEDENPNLDQLEGVVIFKPSVNFISYPNAVPKFTTAMTNRQYNLVDAQLDEQGRKYVKLEACTDGAVPESFTWTATFVVSYKGIVVKIPDVTFSLEAGQDIDLSDHLTP